MRPWWSINLSWRCPCRVNRRRSWGFQLKEERNMRQMRRLTDGVTSRKRWCAVVRLLAGHMQTWKKEMCLLSPSVKARRVIKLRPGAKQIASEDQAIELLCFEPIRKQATIGCLYSSSLDRHLEAVSLFTKIKKRPLNCRLALIKSVWCCEALCARIVFCSSPEFNNYCCAFLILLLLADSKVMSRTQICVLPRFPFTGQEKTLTAEFQQFKLPELQPRGQVQQTKAFQQWASLQQSRTVGQRLQGK